MAHNIPSLFIRSLTMKHVRCFKQSTVHFDKPIILIEAPNGAGKTTVLEVLYYMCYLRSFRSHRPHDLVQFGATGFFCKMQFDVITESNCISRELHVGFADGTRRVKLDNQRVSSYQNLMSTYRVISITEHDLELIGSGPHVRRAFLDHMIMLNNPEYITKIRLFRTVLEQRNMLFVRGSYGQETYDILTEQLYACTTYIQQERIAALDAISKTIEQLQIPGMQQNITLSYQPKVSARQPFASVKSQIQALQGREKHMKRSLFGAHLDDFEIWLDGKQSKHFSSRGQQKLVILLVKCSQLRLLYEQQGGAVMLIDDFMTDFDRPTIELFIQLFSSLNSQLIFTCPVTKSSLHRILKNLDTQYLALNPK